jgi:hypothetical protein
MEDVLTVPTFKVFIKIVMFDMNRLDIMHLKNKCWRSSWMFDSLQRWHLPLDIDRRNCISEYSKIKKCIPKDYLKFLKNENNDIDNKTKSRNKMKLFFHWNSLILLLMSSLLRLFQIFGQWNSSLKTLFHLSWHFGIDLLFNIVCIILIFTSFVLIILPLISVSLASLYQMNDPPETTTSRHCAFHHARPQLVRIRSILERSRNGNCNITFQNNHL